MRAQTKSFPNQKRADAKLQDEQIPNVLADVRAMRVVQALEGFLLELAHELFPLLRLNDGGMAFGMEFISWHTSGGWNMDITLNHLPVLVGIINETQSLCLPSRQSCYAIIYVRYPNGDNGSLVLMLKGTRALVANIGRRCELCLNGRHIL